MKNRLKALVGPDLYPKVLDLLEDAAGECYREGCKGKWGYCVACANAHSVIALATGEPNEYLEMYKEHENNGN